MVTWFIVLGVILGIFLVHLSLNCRSQRKRTQHQPLLEMGTDEEILYCPGDEKGDGHDEL